MWCGYCRAEDQLLSRLDTRLHEIDTVMATLRTQRKAVAALRAKVSVAWAEGECLAVADLIHGMVHQQARPSPPRSRKSKAKSVS